jgi:WD40 repeat protein
MLMKLKLGASGCTLVLAIAAIGPSVRAQPAHEQVPAVAAPGKNQTSYERTNNRLDQHGDPLPEQALFRIGTTRLQHQGQVQAVAASQDGNLLASIGSDRKVRVWDGKDGRPVWTFELGSRERPVYLSAKHLSVF